MKELNICLTANDFFFTDYNVVCIDFSNNHEICVEYERAKELKQQILNNQAIVKKINSLIEMYESLNIRHKESYEESNDDSYLNTIASNSEHIAELQDLLDTTYHSSGSGGKK